MMVPQQDLTVLASGCAVSGRVAGRDLDVLGRFEGDLDLSGRVHVASGSQVKGRVRANLVEIDGDFEGEVREDDGCFVLGAGDRVVTVIDPWRILKDGVSHRMNYVPLGIGSSSSPDLQRNLRQLCE